ncbi:hypothetical protein ACLUWF_03110 [Limosilactobacillus mucosae]|jgi:hypothetical protein|uniref:hypothetical protein n=1 Tax=Limosilactobacillus mucosae TaxID=97478 RepID=UPI003993F242
MKKSTEESKNKLLNICIWVYMVIVAIVAVFLCIWCPNILENLFLFGVFILIVPLIPGAIIMNIILWLFGK